MTTVQTDFFLSPLQTQNDSYWEYADTDTSGYNFERIDQKFWRNFLFQSRAWAFYAAGIYLVGIFRLESYMKNRPAFDLRNALILWNGGLGVFSIIGFLRTFPDFGRYTNLFDTICMQGYNSPAIVFWSVAFGVSKFVELGDTVFIVLRKRPLQLLQWFHHFATLIVVWITLPYAEPIGRIYVTMNYAVHGFMYPYFFLKVAGVHIPKIISSMITTAQFSQMIIGFVLNAVTIGFVCLGFSCYRTPLSIASFLAVYGSFMVLFGKLFINSVMKPRKNKTL